MTSKLSTLEKYFLQRDQCEGWMGVYRDTPGIQTWAHKYFASQQELAEQEIQRILGA